MDQKPKLTSAQRYSLASKKVLENLPKWKKHAVLEDLANNNHDSRIMSEYANEVIRVAEDDKETLSITE